MTMGHDGQDGAAEPSLGAVETGPVGAPISVSSRMVEEFEASLERCMSGGDFISSFYESFLASSPEVKRKFENTDFDKQRKILASSLYLMSRAALGLNDGLAHLDSIAHSHSKKNLDIPPSLYNLWLSALVKTAWQHDPMFSAQLEQVWRALLGVGIRRMVEVYRSLQTQPPVRRS